MKSVSENVRRITTFLLAAYLWIHALFFLNVQSSLFLKLSHYLQLTTSETVLLSLLIIFTFASGAGFWRRFLSLLYIYAFPFVIFWKLLHLLTQALWLLHKWFKRQAYQSGAITPVAARSESATITVASPPTPEVKDRKQQRRDLFEFVSRPFRRFLPLWCILLVVSTHRQIVWICLAVVVVHLARRIFSIAKYMLFFDPALERGIAKMLEVIGTAIDAVSAFTGEASPSLELRNSWSQVKTWRFVTGFLRNDYLVSRWALVIGAATFGFLYVYIALLFSFVYLGITKVSGIPYSWPESLVSSLFIPLFASELPRTLTIRVVSGLHFFLVIAVGASTFYSFLKRRLSMVRSAATIINDRMTATDFDAKFSVLGARISASPAVSAQPIVAPPPNRDIPNKDAK